MGCPQYFGKMSHNVQYLLVVEHLKGGIMRDRFSLFANSTASDKSLSLSIAYTEVSQTDFNVCL